jgi:hypothetical protein
MVSPPRPARGWRDEAGEGDVLQYLELAEEPGQLLERDLLYVGGRWQRGADGVVLLPGEVDGGHQALRRRSTFAVRSTCSAVGARQR